MDLFFGSSVFLLQSPSVQELPGTFPLFFLPAYFILLFVLRVFQAILYFSLNKIRGENNILFSPLIYDFIYNMEEDALCDFSAILISRKLALERTQFGGFQDFSTFSKNIILRLV